ncbi:OmpA family protein [Vibrio sp. PP-XX7]
MNIKITTLFFLLFSFSIEATDLVDKAQDPERYIPNPKVQQSFDLDDADQDGVINARDLCPNTPIEAQIDNQGCETYAHNKAQTQLRILFEHNSAKIDSIFQDQLKTMAKFLKAYPSTSIELKGYASKTGNSKYNWVLSQRRAEAVQDQLIRDGIRAERIQIIGYGEIESEKADQVSQARDRLVSAIVVGYKGTIEKKWTIFTTLPQKTQPY